MTQENWQGINIKGGTPNIYNPTFNVGKPKPSTPPKSIPYRGSANFVGRERELELLHQDLQRGDYVAISAVAGMGGVGKTELATQYARRHRDQYVGICWFSARETNLAGEVLQFFRLQLNLEIPQELEGRQLSLKEQVEWCWHNYPDFPQPSLEREELKPEESDSVSPLIKGVGNRNSSQSLVLVVFDDVTDIANLREVVPTDSRFRVLVTTRLRNLDRKFIQEIPLDVLSPEKEPGKALELLQRLLGERDRRVAKEAETAGELCKWLGYLPLGIELVGTYLADDPDLSLQGMLERLETQKLADEAIQQRETLSPSQRGVKAAFELTWERLGEGGTRGQGDKEDKEEFSIQNSIAQQLGMFLSLFSPKLIPWDLVVRVALGDGEGGEDDGEEEKLAWTEAELNEAKKQLYKRNLIQQVEEREGCYKVHSLVRWFLQDKLAEFDPPQLPLERDLRRTFAAAMIKIAQQIPDSPTVELIEAVRDTIPHVEEVGHSLIEETKKTREKTSQKSSIQNPVTDAEVIWVFAGIGIFYEGQGLYQLAEPWHKQCVEVVKTRLGDSHLDVASSLNNLAILYYFQGRYQEAEPLYLEALDLRKRLLGDSHPRVASSLNNLALLYDSQGRYQEAEPLYLEALDLSKRLLGDSHPDVATSLHNLALLYDSQGRYQEAEPLFLEALAILEQTVGENHPNTITCRNNLASMLSQRSPSSIWMRRLGQFLGIVLRIAILPLYLLWLLVKQLKPNIDP